MDETLKDHEIGGWTKEERQREWAKRLTSLILFGREMVDAGDSVDSVAQGLLGMVEHERERFWKDMEQGLQPGD